MKFTLSLIEGFEITDVSFRATARNLSSILEIAVWRARCFAAAQHDMLTLQRAPVRKEE